MTLEELESDFLMLKACTAVNCKSCPRFLAKKIADAFRKRDERIAALESAIRGIIKVADRATVEFDAAKAALTPAPHTQPQEGT